MRQSTRIATILLSAITFACCVAASGQVPRAAEVPAYGIDARSVTLTIVRAEFVKELKGSHAKFVEPDPEKYRGLVVTVKIADPPAEFVLRNKDFTLHYEWGRDARNAAQCAGLSACTSRLDEQREMMLCTPNINLSREVKPTGTECYVDLFFTDMEVSTRQIELCLATPLAPPVHLPLASRAALDDRTRAAQAPRNATQLSKESTFAYRIVDATSIEYDRGFYREVCVTLQIRKQAGQAVALHSSDFSLHYVSAREGKDDQASSTDCDGMSSFSLAVAGERRLEPVPREQREPRTRPDLKRITDGAMQDAEELYVDLRFRGVRPEPKELHVLHARPVTAAFAVKGWREDQAPKPTTRDK